MDHRLIVYGQLRNLSKDVCARTDTIQCVYIIMYQKLSLQASTLLSRTIGFHWTSYGHTNYLKMPSGCGRFFRTWFLGVIAELVRHLDNSIDMRLFQCLHEEPWGNVSAKVDVPSFFIKFVNKSSLTGTCYPRSFIG